MTLRIETSEYEEECDGCLESIDKGTPFATGIRSGIHVRILCEACIQSATNLLAAFKAGWIDD